MKKPSPFFRTSIFVLLLIWFLLMVGMFYVYRPIAIFTLLPNLVILGGIILAAYSIGSIASQILRIDDLLPTEDFVLSTALGLGGLSLLTMIVSLFGVITWWSVAIGLFICIASGFNRIIGLVTPPAYLFGPEELGDEAPDPVEWLQYIAISLWIFALLQFCLVPPASIGSLGAALGSPQQWIIAGGLFPDPALSTESVTATGGLFAMAIALRGPHLAMMVNGLIAALILAAVFGCIKRYSGPLVARTSFLIASTLPIFVFAMLTPGPVLPTVLMQFCAFFCVQRWFDEKKKRWAVITGIFIGLSVAVSPLSIFYILPLSAVCIVFFLTRKMKIKLVVHYFIVLAAAFVTLLPWMLIHVYLFHSATSFIEPFTKLQAPSSFLEGLVMMLSIPSEISFPQMAKPIWQEVGPLFLVFIPFYFVIGRKNPMSKMAISIAFLFVAFGTSFGLRAEDTLVALLLLAAPASLAAHRFLEKGMRKNIVVGLLYILIGWHVFTSTAVVEDVFNNPQRFLLGVESKNDYLGRAVPYYNAALHVNETFPDDARILGIGLEGNLYFERKCDIAPPTEAELLIEHLSNIETIPVALEMMQIKGYTHLLINTNIPDDAYPFRRVRQRHEARLGTVAQNLSDYLISQDGSILMYKLDE